jgi:poly(glycerol-phosphate) alpha-glucosyltransferase
VIAGWDQIGHEAELRRLANSLEIEKSVHLVGPAFGIEKDSSFSAATAFVLPSISEGLPMVVLGSGPIN